MHSRLNLLENDPRNETELFKRLESKPSPTWNVDSKETTPKYIRDDFDETAHWKSLCELNRQRLLSSGITTAELEEIRCSNPDPDYWRLETELYDTEFWRLQQLRQPQIRHWKATKIRHEKPKSSLDDDPISSRLRKRTSHNSKISKNSGITPLGNWSRNRSSGTGTYKKPRGSVKSKY
jgi:hypothetical protein